MKPDVLPCFDCTAVMSKGDVAYLLMIDFVDMLRRQSEKSPFVAHPDHSRDRGNRVFIHGSVSDTAPGEYFSVADAQPFGPLMRGTFLRFKSLTGETDWESIASWMSNFPAAERWWRVAVMRQERDKNQQHA